MLREIFYYFIFNFFLVQDGRYVPYMFDNCVWTTPHNTDHGYIRDITAISVTGKYRVVYPLHVVT